MYLEAALSAHVLSSLLKRRHFHIWNLSGNVYHNDLRVDVFQSKVNFPEINYWPRLFVPMINQNIIYVVLRQAKLLERFMIFSTNGNGWFRQDLNCPNFFYRTQLSQAMSFRGAFSCFCPVPVADVNYKSIDALFVTRIGSWSKSCPSRSTKIAKSFGLNIKHPSSSQPLLPTNHSSTP